MGGDRLPVEDVVAWEFVDQPPVTLMTCPAHRITTVGLRLPEVVLV